MSGPPVCNNHCQSLNGRPTYFKLRFVSEIGEDLLRNKLLNT